jgi:signal transduction histidine kinase
MNPLATRLHARLDHASPALRAGLGVLLLALAATADHVTGPQRTAILLYALVVVFGAWYVAPGFALVVSIAAGASSLGVETLHADASADPSTALWNVTTRLAALLVVAWLAIGRRKSFDQLRTRAASDAVMLESEQSYARRLYDELLVREAEKRRIGQDLHDGLSQHLTATMLASKALEEKLAFRAVDGAAEAQRITHLLIESIARVQRLARGLSPADLLAMGLAGALQHLAETTQSSSGIACTFSSDVETLALDEVTATHLFRICQESVNNALRHAGGRTISIALVTRGDAPELTVTDDGVGMRPEVGQEGIGLRSMRERAQVIGGTLEVHSAPGHGTRVVCRVKGTRERPVTRRTSENADGVRRDPSTRSLTEGTA